MVASLCSSSGTWIASAAPPSLQRAETGQHACCAALESSENSGCVTLPKCTSSKCLVGATRAIALPTEHQPSDAVADRWSSSWWTANLYHFGLRCDPDCSPGRCKRAGRRAIAIRAKEIFRPMSADTCRGCTPGLLGISALMLSSSPGKVKLGVGRPLLPIKQPDRDRQIMIFPPAMSRVMPVIHD